MRSAVAERLAFPEDSFDLALAQLVVHFMADPVSRLSEMARGHPSRRPGRRLRVGSRRRRRSARHVLAGCARHRSTFARRVGAGRGSRRSPGRALRSSTPEGHRVHVADRHRPVRHIRRLVGAVHARRRTGRCLCRAARRGATRWPAQAVCAPSAAVTVRDRCLSLVRAGSRLTAAKPASLTPSDLCRHRSVAGATAPPAACGGCLAPVRHPASQRGGDMFSRVDDTQNDPYHLVQRHRCTNLMTGRPAQQRLDGLDVIQEAT